MFAFFVRVPAGLGEELQRLQLLVADEAAAVGLRRLVDLAEDFLGHLAAQGFENRQFLGVGQFGGGHLGLREVALLAHVEVAHHLPVGPLEIPQHGDRLAHAAVLEHRLVEVEGETLGGERHGFGQYGLLQPALAQGGAFVAHGEAGGRVFAVVVVGAGQQQLAGYLDVGEELDFERVEVIEPAADRQVLRPPILDPFEGHAAPRLDMADTVGAAAQRRLVTVAAGEVAGLPPVLGKNPHARQIQRQAAVVIGLEVEADLQRAFHADLSDVAVELPIAQAGLGHQGLEGEPDIFGADRLAIVEARLGVDEEAHPAVVRVALHLLGDQSIDAVGFVQRAIGQRLVDPGIDLRHPGGLVHVGQQVGEAVGFLGRAAQRTALGRVRIDVVEMFEIGRVFGRFAIYGHGRLQFGAQGAAREEWQCAGQQQWQCAPCEGGRQASPQAVASVRCWASGHGYRSYLMVSKNPRGQEPGATGREYSRIVPGAGAHEAPAPTSEVVGHATEQDSAQRIGVARVITGLEVVRLIAERRVAVEHVLQTDVDVQGLVEGIARRHVPNHVGRHALVAIVRELVAVAAGIAIDQRST